MGAIASAVLPAVGKLATLAVEELGAYLQRKRNKALTVALQEMDDKIGVTLNEMHQLERISCYMENLTLTPQSLLWNCWTVCIIGLPL